MRYRIYFRHDDTNERSVQEVTTTGVIHRVCDDHGRVIFGKPWPKRESFIDPLDTREPSPY